MMEKEVHFYVFGRVQGVGYRRWCQRTAQQHGLCGWVRNKADGKVEVFAYGDSLTVDLFLKACLEGPLWARVDRLIPVDFSPEAIKSFCENEFKILATK